MNEPDPDLAAVPFNKKIIFLRARSKKSPRDFGLLFKVGGPAVSDWEKGKHVPQSKAVRYAVDVAFAKYFQAEDA